MKKRIVALFLCLSMLMTMFVGAVAAEDGSYSANVGRYAVIAEEGYGLQVGNFTDISTGNDMYFAYEEFEPGTIFKITDWYLDSETQSLWYAVEFYAGGVIPESQEDWPAAPWVLQDYVGEEAMGDSLAFLDGCDICGKPDCGGHESVGDTTKVFVDGVEAQQLTMPQFDKPTLSAATTLTGAVAYQWQILADRETELWVNIYGEDQPDLTLTYGMVASLLDSNYQAQVRCVTTAGDTKSVSEALTITLEPRVIPVAPDAEDPTEPTEETTEPTEETTEPTEETTEPTEETTEPTEETTEPTEETTEPTEETTEPTEETTEPTEETTEPTEETAEPTEETTEPTEETAEPTEETTEPTEETAEPTEETTEPTEETTEPTEGVAELSNEVEQLPEVQVTYTAATTLADGSDEELHTHDIVVSYVFEGTNIAASSQYTANIGHGDPFAGTVTFPTVLGYEPIVNINGSWVQQDSYTFDIPSVTEDVVVEVRYRPALVSYKVYVHLQNVDDDGYPESVIEDSGLARTGSTNYEFDQENVKYPGFYQLPYEKPPIAADGSTTVEIYFDRYYYLMKFDQDGGYGAEPIYARYGTPLSVSEPTKAGFEFIGWDGNGDGKADPIPATMPYENTSFKALWREENTVKVTVVFWGENADDERYSYMPDYTKEVYVKPGISFTYTEAADLVCGYDTEHTHSDLCGYSCDLVEHVHSVGYDCYTLTCPLEEHFHSEDCNTCNAETHNHTTACYSGVGTIYTGYLYGAPPNPNEGEVYAPWYSSNKYIYINGSWYSYTGNTASGGIADTTCGKTEDPHTHTDACIGCGKTEHAHSVEDNCYDTTPICGLDVHSHVDQCYNCGQKEHSHSNSCHLDQSRPEDALWRFVKSDTVTVKADGTTVVNVYYDRTEFTLTFRYNNATVATITDKWGAKISDEFAKAPFNTTHNGYAWQCTESSKYSAALQTLDIMPQFNATFTRYNRSSTTLKTIYYYVQIPGTTVSSTQWPTNTNNFTLLKEVNTYFNYATYEEEYHEMVGYVRYSKDVAGFSSNRKNFSNNKLYLYYLCDSFDITFNNGVDEVTETVPYGLSLEGYASYVPDAPDIYEPGSVGFDGWYQNPECTGEEYILSEHTMPANDLLLYAKWKKVSHTVKVYPSAEDAQNQTNQIGETQSVLHGDMAAAPETPENDPYQFVGWFYTLDGEEYAFDFENMPVVRDLVLYAKWSSNVMVDYTVRYLKYGTEEPVAPEETGSGLAGYNKTFEAADALDGWFPLVKSTGLTLDLDETKNVCTFYYVQQEAVPYEVRYVTIIDGQEVDLSEVEGIVNAPETKYVSDNRKAVVTENFVPVAGYLPDASYKTLVVSADGKDNVITFVYTQDELNAYYIVSDWIQDVDGVTWIRRIREEGSNKIGTEYTRDPITIPGFTYDAGNENNLSSGTLQKNEILELNFYYTRNEYPYQISYLEFGTEKVLADPVVYTGEQMAYYGEAVTAKNDQILNIDGYKLHSVKGCTIGAETNVDALHQNVVKVYYVPVTGNLRVTKDIEIINSNAPVPSDQVFEFTLHLPDGIAGSYSVTIGGNKQVIPAIEGKLKFYLKDGESALIEGLPQGPSTNKYQYTVTETPVPGFESSFSPSGAVEVTQDETTEIICINQYPVGNLKIVKKVEKEFSGDTWTGDRFSFTITSDALNRDGKEYMVSINGGNEVAYPANDHSIVIKDVEVSSANPEVTIEIANVPAGSYTVTENDGSALGATYTTTANGETGYSATVTVEPVEDPALVTFVNTVKRTTGNLYVSKMIQIVPDSGAEIDEAAEFTFTVQMPTDKPENFFAGKTYTVKEHATLTSVTVDENGRFTFQLKHNEHVIIEDLPVGSYVVTESFSEGYASSFPVANPDDGSVSAEVVITTDAEPRLECVNTYPVHRGNLKITKTVQAASGIQKNPADTFQFQIAFTPKGSSRDFPATHYDKNGEQTPVELAVTETSSGKVQLTAWLKDGESILIENLPAGECTVTEVDIPAIYTAVGNNRKVTIAADQTTAITMTNQYKLVDLTIEKTNAEEDQVFVYEIKDSEGKIITVTVVGNSSTTIHNLLPGNYTVTQENLWSWRYDKQDESKTVEVDEVGEKVIFSDKVSDDHWLDGNSQLVVNRKGA